jgi:hypothetical protein
MKLRFRYLPFLILPLGLSGAIHLNGLERPRSDSDDHFRLSSSTFQNNRTLPLSMILYPFAHESKPECMHF